MRIIIVLFLLLSLSACQYDPTTGNVKMFSVPRSCSIDLEPAIKCFRNEALYRIEDFRVVNDRIVGDSPLSKDVYVYCVKKVEDPLPSEREICMREFLKAVFKF